MSFILNLCYCLPSTLALIQLMSWYDKIARLKGMSMAYAMSMSMTTPGIDSGLYDISVIYYNTVTM